ncbi:MAG: hypothetical protein ABSH08_16000 [Tepidisphaeraceae bacterium]|jgi:hypothetical protein
MEVNIDKVIEKLIGWNLQLTVDGKTVSVRPPDNALIALAGKLNAGGMSEPDAVAALRQALSGTVDGDIKNWNAPQLIGALNAIFEHAKQTRGNSIAGLGLAVRAAMRPEKPAAPARAKVQDDSALPAVSAPWTGPAVSEPPVPVS